MDEKLGQQLVETALSMGADDAKIFQIEDVAFDPRTLLKCLFGCTGGYHYCPSKNDVGASAAYTEMIKRYQWGVLICTDNLKTGQDITLKLESRAFLSGCYFAFGATECAACKSCSYEDNAPCINKRKQRIPLYALGIDVYKTVRNLGWELEVVQVKGDPVKNITAVFVE